MKRILILGFFLSLFASVGQAQIVKGTGIIYFDSIPNASAQLPNGAEIAYSIKLKKLYYWNRTGLAWEEFADAPAGIDTIYFASDTLYIESGIDIFKTHIPISTGAPDALAYTATTQQLSIVGSNTVSLLMNTDSTLSGSNTSAQPLSIAQQSATSGQVLKWNGTRWAPAADNTGSGMTGFTWGNGTSSTSITDGETITVRAGDGLASALSGNDIYLSISQNGATDGQVLKWNGGLGQWLPASDNTGGAGSTDLSFSGTSGTIGLLSSSGTDVNFAQGTGISLSQTGGTLTIASTVTNTDAQTLSWNSGTGNLTISGGNAISLDGRYLTAETGDISAVTAGTGLSGGGTTGAVTLNIANTGVTAQSYGNATSVPAITVNAQGQITAANNVNIAIGASQITISGALPGEVLKWNGTAWAPATDNTGSGATDLAFSGSIGPVSLTSSTGTDVSFDDGNGTSVSQTGGVLRYNLNSVGTPGTYVVTTTDTYGRVTSGTGLSLSAQFSGTGLSGSPITLASQSASTGQVLKWNGSSWAPASDETGGSGSTDLSFSGASGTIGLLSSSGTDVNFAPGTGISLSQTGGTLTIASTVTNTDAQTLSWNSGTGNLTISGGNAVSLDGRYLTAETDGSVSNEGSLTVGAGTPTTSLIQSNTSGSTAVTLSAGGIISLSESGNTITIAATEVDGSTTNELQNLGYTAATGALTISSGTGTTIPVMVGATSGVAGVRGLVPGPSAGQEATFLRGDGTWATPSVGGDNWGSQVVQVSARFSGNGTAGTPLELASQSATTGQVLKWNGTSWAPDTDLTGSGGLADPGSNGIVVRTGSGTTAAREITGTTNRVSVTNGTGVAGNISLNLPQDIHTAAAVTFGSATIDGNLGIRAASTASTATQIPVFIADPTSTTRTIVTRTPAQLRSDIGAGTGNGTVTSVGGTGTVSGLTLSGTVSTTGNLTLGGTLAVTASNFSSQTANTFLAAPNGSAGVPTFRAIVAADIPTLNQNTTGTASNVTGTVAIANGGTGATTAPNARTNLGGTTVGQNFFTLANPTAITFPRINADNTVTALSATDFRTAIGAGTGSVTSVGGTGTVSGLTLSGTVTTTGNLTLGGTLSVTPSNFASQTANTFLAAPNGSAGVPTFRAIVAADIPTLNQNTSGTSANVTGIVAIANGGTGSTTAPNARTALGATTVGSNFFTVANPGAIRFPRVNADNSVSLLTDSDFRTAIGATGTGTVTQVNTGTGLSGGPFTTSGTISIANTGVTASSYGAATTVPVITVNAQGQITAATPTSIAIPTSQITASGASTAGQVIKWNGSAWAPGTDDNSGGSTIYTANGSLTGARTVTLNSNALKFQGSSFSTDLPSTGYVEVNSATAKAAILPTQISANANTTSNNITAIGNEATLGNTALSFRRNTAYSGISMRSDNGIGFRADANYLSGDDVVISSNGYMDLKRIPTSTPLGLVAVTADGMAYRDFGGHLSGNSESIFVVPNSVTTASPSNASTYTAAWNSAASQIINLNVASLTSLTMGLPTNPRNGGVYSYHLRSVGSLSVTWNAAFKDLAGTNMGTKSYTSSQIITCYYDGTNYYCQ